MFKGYKKMGKENSLIIFIAIVFIWAGMILGISFIEAPLKFQAPNVSLIIGLGIGRLVFNALNKFEIFFTLMSWFLIYKIRTHRITIPMMMISSIIIIQSVILLPALDFRAEALINGKAISGESPHFFYVILEVIKVILLITTGTIATKELLKKRHG